MRRGQSMVPGQSHERGLLPFLNGGDGAFLSASPWQLMRRMQEDMEMLFSQALSGQASPTQGRDNTPVWAPRVDISEDGQEFRVEAELPGVKQDDIQIRIEKGFLLLRAEMRQEQEMEAQPTGEQKGEAPQRRYHQAERRFGFLERVLALPDSVDDEHIRAEFRDGVLIIHLPKTQQAAAQGRTVPIDGSSGQPTTPQVTTQPTTPGE